MHTWYILDTCPLLGKCFFPVCGLLQVSVWTPLSFLPQAQSYPDHLYESDTQLTSTVWQSFRCSNSLMAISQGTWTLMCPQMNLLSFPQSIPHLEQWHYLVSAGWDQLSLQTPDPRPSPGSIQCCLPILACRLPVWLWLGLPFWLCSYLLGFWLDTALGSGFMFCLSSDSTRRGAPFQLTCPGQVWGTPDHFCLVSAAPSWSPFFSPIYPDTPVHTINVLSTGIDFSRSGKGVR